MPYNPFSVPNRVRKHPHTDSRVIIECSIGRYSQSFFFFFFQFFEYNKFRTRFAIKHALSTLFIIDDDACINGVLCWDCNIYIYIFFYFLCKIVGRESRQTVHNEGRWVPEIKIFMPTDFVTSYMICGLDSELTMGSRWSVYIKKIRDRILT
jgi:hypothetical protein